MGNENRDHYRATYTDYIETVIQVHSRTPPLSTSNSLCAVSGLVGRVRFEPDISCWMPKEFGFRVRSLIT